MLPNRLQHLSKDIRDLDFSKGERFGFHVEDEMLDFESEGFRIDNEVWGAAAFDHEFASAVSVKFGDGAEQI